MKSRREELWFDLPPKRAFINRISKDKRQRRRASETSGHGKGSRRGRNKRQTRLRPLGADFLRRIRRRPQKKSADQNHRGKGKPVKAGPPETRSPEPIATPLPNKAEWLKAISGRSNSTKPAFCAMSISPSNCARDACSLGSASRKRAEGFRAARSCRKNLSSRGTSCAIQKARMKSTGSPE